ncbi:MAG: FHA domain-containing protein [Planctomycetes bacterium]|nr:FHA domain-containing protein [Planctomycetota bacterium]
MAAKIEIHILEGVQAGETHTLSGIVVIGRGPACTLQVEDPAVSREHVMLREAENSAWVIEDLDSRSGTLVNGVRTRTAVLLDNDEIQLGTLLLKLRILSTKPLVGEVAPEDVKIVTNRFMPTTRLSLDVVKFRTSARYLKDSGLGDLIDEESGEAITLPPKEGDSEEVGTEPLTEIERRLELLVEISTSLAAIHQPQHLARETAVRLVGIFPQVRRIGFFTLVEDPGGGEDILRPTYLVDRSCAKGQVQISQSVLQQAIGARRALLSEDIRKDPRFRVSESLEEAGVVSILCAPFCLGQRVLGAIYLDTADFDAPFDEGGLRLVTGVAALLASAFENARLFARVQSESLRRASLERYFSPDLVERVLRGDLPLSREGRRGEGTILFVDIRGFTRLTLTTDPHLLIATLNAYFASMQRIIFRTRGTVERFGGDSILAYWGIIDDQDAEAPSHALRAALAMQVEVFRLNPELSAAGRPPIQIGIGLNSGEVIAGDVGSAERYEFTIFGDAINMASRFESLAKAWEVIAGQATVDAATPDLVLHEPLAPLTVKGKDALVHVSLVYGLRLDRPSGEAYWELAVPAQVWLEGDTAPTETLASGIEVQLDGTIALEILTAADPIPGSRAAVRLARPRSTESIRVEGSILAAETLETLMLSGPNLAVTGSGVQRIRVRLDGGEDALRYLGAKP